MKKLLAIASSAIVLVSMSAGIARADRRDVTVQNDTDLTMIELYVSSYRSSDWGVNRLPYSVESGETFDLRFTNNSAECVYDVKAVYEDGSYDLSQNNLCETGTLYYYGHGGTENSSAVSHY
jgi:hypothetical protein